MGQISDLSRQIELLALFFHVFFCLLLAFIDNAITDIVACIALLTAVDRHTVSHIEVFLHIVGCKRLHFSQSLLNRIVEEASYACFSAPYFVADLHLEAQFVKD